jgi:Flp pilus assembly protein TadG
VEFVLIFPVLTFLFFGTFDMGFYMYALVSTQNAARVAALDTSASSARSGSTTVACADVLTELNMMPNAASFPASCNALPLQVTAQAVVGPDGKSASKVSVTYQTSQVIPIPGLTGQLTITRIVQMRARS